MATQNAAEKRHSTPQFAVAVRDFEEAVRLFQKQKYDKAKEILAELVNSPAHEVAARARVHLQLCDQKLGAPAKPLTTRNAEEVYNMGIVELNASRVESAIEHLNRADKMAPNQEHIRYALAIAHAIQGNMGAALEHLSSAIGLNPLNRVRARRDEELQSLAADPRFKQLLNS